MRRLLVIALALIAMPALAASPSPDGPLGLDQILALVGAGVGDAIILRQAAPAGIAFTLGVDEVLALKRAGASDSLIGSLMDMTAPAAVPGSAAAAHPTGAGSLPSGAGSPVEPSFRIYPEVDVEGQTVIHITNLDASGRRMGPPAAEEEAPPSNAYESRRDSEAAEGWEPWEVDPGYGGGRSQGAPPPVIVNVFNPVAEAAALSELEPDSRYVSSYDRRYMGGYLPYQPCSHAGHGGRHSYGVPSPPGSWSHYMLYHGEGSIGHADLYDGGLAWRSRQPATVRAGALPVPFHTAGADSLNRMRARVRLGH